MQVCSVQPEVVPRHRSREFRFDYLREFTPLRSCFEHYLQKKQREKKKNSLVDIQYALTLDIFQIKFTHSSDALALPTHTLVPSKNQVIPGECEMLIRKKRTKRRTPLRASLPNHLMCLKDR